jgi:hypothetical protein
MKVPLWSPATDRSNSSCRIRFRRRGLVRWDRCRWRGRRPGDPAARQRRRRDFGYRQKNTGFYVRLLT